MPDYVIESKEIYRCFSYIKASSKEEALELFNSGNIDDGPHAHEWHDSYKSAELRDVKENK